MACRHGVLFSSAAGGAYWPIAIRCPSLGPFPSTGGGAHRPLTTLRPSSSSLPNFSPYTSLSFPLVPMGEGVQEGGGGGGRDLLERGGGGGEGVRGEGSPPPVGTYLVLREQKIYWAMNHSAHGNVILLVANKANSSLQVNSGFPHLIKTQQIQQSGTFTISCQLTVIMVNQN